MDRLFIKAGCVYKWTNIDYNHVVEIQKKQSMWTNTWADQLGTYNKFINGVLTIGICSFKMLPDLWAFRISTFSQMSIVLLLLSILMILNRSVLRGWWCCRRWLAKVDFSGLLYIKLCLCSLNLWVHFLVVLPMYFSPYLQFSSYIPEQLILSMLWLIFCHFFSLLYSKFN